MPLLVKCALVFLLFLPLIIYPSVADERLGGKCLEDLQHTVFEVSSGAKC